MGCNSCDILGIYRVMEGNYMEQLISYDRGRPVEWLAVFCIIYGYVPSRAYKNSYASPSHVYRNPRKSNNLVRMNEFDGMLLKHETKICPECLRDLPESGAFWPSNRDGRNGLYSKCRDCKQETDNRRYRHKARVYPS